MSTGREASGRKPNVDLKRIFSLDGVRMSLVIDPEGEVEEEMGAENIDGDQLAAVVSFVMAESRAMATRLGDDQISMVFVEFRDIALLSLPLDEGYFLLLLTDPSANVGQISYELKKSQESAGAMQ
ncbi:MAG: Roadblock/LC7 domain protein [Methanoregulaceae archaeon PtaB.Bin108]|jgi:predicted regulator of Ras-like GTPase activity (Roadblock/LC7/MglB family)|nr:MAG: Roadblock/LC7 domain protein [Methanoregulaceae archaeon PtaB.Bin108]OPY43185.1 MAG: Roadblock/LC7 domain protein [Methanoregulaceae archaeon PtaU1.Bin222]